jgi:DNA replication protein DnaC
MKTIEIVEKLKYLKLHYLAENLIKLMEQADLEKLDKIQFLEMLLQCEEAEKLQRAVKRRIEAAKVPVYKTLEKFDFTHPKSIDKEKVRFLFRLDFINARKNVIFIGGVGLGKTHLASALAIQACQSSHTVLFTTAVQIINSLNEAQNRGNFVQILKKYLKVDLLIIDELGYMPIDKMGCDLIFQVISGRYEKSSTIITTNRVYKDWAYIFNNDTIVTSAILDRVLHHSETVKIEGPSYRMSDRQI